METIYLTYDELQQFLMTRYLVLAKKYEKQSKQRNIIIEYRTLTVVSKQKVILISQLQQISLPNDAFFPQLRSLFGVPAGLLVSRNESFEYKPKAKIEKWQCADIIYLAHRRALLYANAWAVKSLDISRVEYFFNTYFPQLSAPTMQLYSQLLENIAQTQHLPIQKPAVESINDTVYDYQLIWLGKAVGKSLLNGDRMSDQQRDWFINATKKPFSGHHCQFGDADLLILAYQLVMEMYNADKLSFMNCMKASRVMSGISDTDKYCMVLLALLIMGMLDKKADNYFMVAGAAQLFTSIENSAYMFAFVENSSVDALSGFDSVKDAILHKYENCVAYYQMKNPNISSKFWALYGEDNSAHWPDILPIIEPDGIIHFLIENDKVLSIDNFINKALIITSNEQLYQSLSGANNILFYDGTVLRGSVLHWEKNQTILTDSHDIKTKFSFLSERIIVDDQLLPSLTEEWILITSDYKIPAVSESILTRMLTENMPRAVYVFNFNTKRTELNLTIPKERKGRKSKSKHSDVNTGTDATLFSKSDFQSRLEQLFGAAKVRIISKSAEEEPWEMVTMGINILQKTNLKNCSIIETRFANKMRSDYEIVMRCFSDVIVYDDKQRYMFMNL